MKEVIADKLYNDIMFDLDTIRIEQTSFEDPDKSYLILKLLKEISDNVGESFNEVRGDMKWEW